MDKRTYVLHTAIPAVRADVHAFKVLDIGTVVTVEGGVSELGLVLVSTGGLPYRVFERDLLERGTAAAFLRAAS